MHIMALIARQAKFIQVSLSADIAKTEGDPAIAAMNVPGMVGSN